MSKDINLVAVCTEKKGRPINRLWPRERGRDTERGGTMGGHQEESPNSCKAPYHNTHTHVHTLTCTHIRTNTHKIHPLLHFLSQSLSLSHTHSFLFTHTLWPGHLNGGQLSRCSATAFNKGCEWLVENKEKEENQTSSFSSTFLPNLCHSNLCQLIRVAYTDGGRQQSLSDTKSP